MVSNYWYEPKVVRIRDSGWKMQIYSLSSPIVIKNFFFTLKLFFLALIFRLLTYSKGQQSFEASKTIDSSNLSARSTKSNSFWSSWIRFYKSKAITFISCKIYIKNSMMYRTHTNSGPLSNIRPLFENSNRRPVFI